MSVSSSDSEYASRDPDVRLMLEVRDGSDKAFEQLMSLYQERVMAVLYHLLGDRQVAEDLTQEAFLRVYRARRGYVPRAKFTTWLYTIVNNLGFSALRRRARGKEVALEPQDSGAFTRRSKEHLFKATSGQMPPRQIEKKERAEIVRVALGQLTDQQCLAVLLSKFEGMSYVDIGEVMELSPEAIKSLLSRARGKLREKLEPYMDIGTRPM